MVLVGLDYAFRFKTTGLYSIKGRLLRNNLIQIWTAFHTDIKFGLSDIFEYAINTDARGHTYKLSISLCPKAVKKRSFAVR